LQTTSESVSSGSKATDDKDTYGVLVALITVGALLGLGATVVKLLSSPHSFTSTMSIVVPLIAAPGIAAIISLIGGRGQLPPMRVLGRILLLSLSR
jgi:hypothetical protein